MLAYVIQNIFLPAVLHVNNANYSVLDKDERKNHTAMHWLNLCIAFIYIKIL